MISPMLLSIPNGTQDIPHSNHDILHGTEHPHDTEHTLYRVRTPKKVIFGNNPWKKSRLTDCNNSRTCLTSKYVKLQNQYVHS